MVQFPWFNLLKYFWPEWLSLHLPIQHRDYPCVFYMLSSTITNNAWLIICFPLCPQGGVKKKKRQVGGYDSRVKSTSFICTLALHTGTKWQHFNHTAGIVMLTDLTLPPTDASGFLWVIFLHNHQRRFEEWPPRIKLFNY